MQIFERLAANGFREMPGAADFVRLMAERFPGRMALVTSSPVRFVLPFLEHYQLSEYFSPHLIISEETMLAQGLKGKPAPDPYKFAMKRLHAKRLLTFEDVVPGVMSAKKAGVTVIALGFDAPNAQLFEAGGLAYPPDAYVKSYAEARQLLNL